MATAHLKEASWQFHRLTPERRADFEELFAYLGLASMFRSAGFKEVARRSETRPMMRYVIGSVEKPYWLFAGALGNWQSYRSGGVSSYLRVLR